MVLMVDETVGRESHNLLVYSDSGLAAVFITIAFGVKGITFRNRTPFVPVQFFEVLNVHFGILAARKANASEGISISPAAIAKRNGNEPIR